MNRLLSDFVATAFGLSLYTLIPDFINLGISFSTIKDFVEIVQLLAGIAGLIYLIYRILDLRQRIINDKIVNSLNNEEKKQIIIAKQNENFYKKFDEEFLKEKDK